MAQDRALQYDPSTDYYHLLGVAPSASIDEINRVYRQRAKQVHPDLNPTRQAWAHQQFQQINAVHTVLSDPGRRAHYDNLRLAYYSQAFSGPPVSQINARRAGPTISSRRRHQKAEANNRRIIIWLIWLGISLSMCSQLENWHSSIDTNNYNNYGSGNSSLPRH